MKINAFILLIAIGLLFTGCNADKDQLAEKAAIEGKAQSKAGIEAENSNLATKARDMESDLAIRHRFYQAVRGSYEGSYPIDGVEYRVKITLVTSLPPYSSGRVRQLDEISSDLNNLYFNAQIVQWNASDPLAAVGCRVEHIRPDIINGEINIASENCPNLYALRIAERSASPSSDDSHLASDYAAMVRDGRVDKVQNLIGEIHPSTNASIYQFSAIRKTR